MDIFWKVIENIIYFIFGRVLHLKLNDSTWKKLNQFVKFSIVGLSNTLISYIVYVILVVLSIHYLIANLAGFLISVINAYYWNDRYVFKDENNNNIIWWKKFLKTFISYAGTGLILNNILLILWIDMLQLNTMIGPILNLFVAIPLNFLLNKYWAFKIKHDE